MKTFKALFLVTVAVAALLIAFPLHRGTSATSGTLLPGSTPLNVQYALSNVFTVAGTEFTNVPASIARPNLRVEQGKGMSFSCTYVGGGTAHTTNNIALAFKVSNAGTTNYTTTNNYIWVYFTPNGTSTVRTYTNVPAAILDNVEYIQLAQITNGNAATNMVAYLTNCIMSQRSN